MSAGRGGAARLPANDVAAELAPVVERAVRVAVEDIGLDAQAAVLLAAKRPDRPVVLVREETLVVAARYLEVRGVSSWEPGAFEGLEASDFSDPVLAAVWGMLDAGAKDETIAGALGCVGVRGADILHTLGAVRLLWGDDLRQAVLELIAAARWRRFVAGILAVNAEMQAKASMGQPHALDGVRARLRALAAEVGPALRAVEGAGR